MKDKTLAGVLAIIPATGGLGVHHFYLGNIDKGVIYLLLSWTGIPVVLGLVDGIMYLVKSDAEFQANYRNWFCASPKGPV
ncbi:MAG: TM2 domain-containing protein [Armatimonadetes bacterium]|jgi:TM2 domain-containing membrane protein YozV|nr:TM2 domain-containing protein [Armatimonadota bacterium]MDI9584131.1 TM2 domain-containing protein [Acidobacteriota bacterium]